MSKNCVYKSSQKKCWKINIHINLKLIGNLWTWSFDHLFSSVTINRIIFHYGALWHSIGYKSVLYIKNSSLEFYERDDKVTTRKSRGHIKNRDIDSQIHAWMWSAIEFHHVYSRCILGNQSTGWGRIGFKETVSNTGLDSISNFLLFTL